MKDTKKVTVAAPNVWTSAGKFLKGDEVELPKDEADALLKNKQVK